MKQTLSDLFIHNCHETRCPLGWLSAVDVSASEVTRLRHLLDFTIWKEVELFFLCLVSHKKLLVVMGTEKESAQANIRLHTTLPSSSNTLLDPRNFHFLGVGTRT